MPLSPTIVPVPFPVPAGITKGRKHRTTWTSYEALAGLYDYLQLDRAAAAADSGWRKSSYSGDNGGECVEVASAGAVLVRDTTDRTGPVLTFTADTWRAFTATIK